MTAPTMIPALRLTAATLAGVIGCAAIALIVWPGWFAALRRDGALWPWSADGWSLLLVDPAGRAMAYAQSPYLLWAVAALAAIAAGACAAGPGGPVPLSARGPLPASQEGQKEFAAELVKALNLLRAQHEAGGVYEAVLARASTQLPATVNPEQVRVIVSYLMVENDNMRKRTRELQASLEQSRRQVENLKSNLAAAKAEGLSDSLTGLKNRRGLDLALASEIAEARASLRPLSLILADLDRFKSVNDTLGHQAGDDVLRWFGKILSANMKGRDTVARFGGEEFAIVLPQTGLDAAAGLAGQIRGQIEQTAWRMSGSPHTTLKITASFGVAELGTDDTSASLIKRADRRLYDAKSGGRNRVAS